MGVSTYVGYRCPHGHESVSIDVVMGGGESRCSVCGVAMVPDQNSPGVTAHAYCPKCKSYSGLITSARCPTCGGPFTALPR